MKRFCHLGVDVVDIEDFAETIQRSGNDFLESAFTPGEVAYCQGRRLQHYAVRWAAKEAFCKAALPGSDWTFQWTDIEVINDAHGVPILRLHGLAEKWAKAMGVEQMSISLSHSRRTAVAAVLIERSKGA